MEFWKETRLIRKKILRLWVTAKRQMVECSNHQWHFPQWDLPPCLWTQHTRQPVKRRQELPEWILSGATLRNPKTHNNLNLVKDNSSQEMETLLRICKWILNRRNNHPGATNLLKFCSLSLSMLSSFLTLRRILKGKKRQWVRVSTKECLTLRVHRNL